MSSAPETVIRLARESELQAVAELTVAAYAADIDLNEGYRAELESAAERAAEHQLWVAVEAAVPGGAGVILGTVTTPRPGERINYFTEPGEMDLRVLAVSPAARGIGIGSALMRHCERLARERGSPRLLLHTSAEMTTAIRLYEHLGFVRQHEIEGSFAFPPRVRFPVRVFAKDLGELAPLARNG